MEYFEDTSDTAEAQQLTTPKKNPKTTVKGTPPNKVVKRNMNTPTSARAPKATVSPLPKVSALHKCNKSTCWVFDRPKQKSRATTNWSSTIVNLSHPRLGRRYMPCTKLQVALLLVPITLCSTALQKWRLLPSKSLLKTWVAIGKLQN